MNPYHNSQHTFAWRVVIIILLLIAIALAHWLTPLGSGFSHGVHVAMRKLFFLPIVLAAVWFNLRGSMVTAAFAMLIYLPHVIFQWQADKGEYYNQVGEIVTMWAIALLAGWLVELEKSALRNVALSHQGALHALVAALDAREHGTQTHSLRVREYALLIGMKMRLSQSAIETLGQAALLHDIGKIGIPDEILLNPGPLNPKQWQLMQTHPRIGEQILLQVPFLHDVAQIIASHHEKYDGTGYPSCLKGQDIPLFARIFAVVDAFDAITSKRSYKTASSIEQARQLIARERGKQFDAHVVDAFLEMKDEQWQSIRDRLGD